MGVIMALAGSHAMSLPPTRGFYQVKYARGYPFVPVKLAGRAYPAAAMVEESHGLHRESKLRRLLRPYGAGRRALRRRVRLEAESRGLSSDPLFFDIFSRFDPETSYELDGGQFFG